MKETAIDTRISYVNCTHSTDWTPDPIGHFIILPVGDRIRVEHWNDRQCRLVFSGYTAEDCRKRIISHFPKIQSQHAGYLGQMLAKCESWIALRSQVKTWIVSQPRSRQKPGILAAQFVASLGDWRQS